MSYHLPPRSPSTGHARKHLYKQDIYQKTPETWSSRYETSSYFASSPLRSSSPPSTPYISRHAHNYAYIRSSPEIEPDYGYSSVGGYLESSSSPWDYNYSSRGTSKVSRAEDPFPRRASISTAGDYPPSSDFDVSEFSDHDLPDVDSEPASDSAPAENAGTVSDSEGGNAEGQDDDEDANLFSFSSNSYRSTFFRTSAERGQWKYDPIPFKPKSVPSLLQTRKSVPTLSRVPTPTLANPTRPISEPAPSTPAENAFVPSTTTPPDQPDPPMKTTPPETIPAPTPSTAEDQLDSPNTVPSLSSDRESSTDADDHEMPASPLPPSSPPLSPMSFSVSIMSRSVSPLSFAPESPAMRSSSPLSELSDDEEDEEPQPVPAPTLAPVTVSNVFKLLNPVDDDDVTMRKPASNSAPASTSEQTVPAHEGSVRPANEAPCGTILHTKSSLASQDILHSEAKPHPFAIDSIPIPPSVSTLSEGDHETESLPFDSKPSQDIVMDSDVIAVPSFVQQESTPAGKHDSMEVDSKATPSGATDNAGDKHVVPVPPNSPTDNVHRPSSEPDSGPSSASDTKDQKDQVPVKEKRKNQPSPDGPTMKKRKTEPRDRVSSPGSSLSPEPEEQPKKTKSKAAGKRKAQPQQDDGAEDATSEPTPPPKEKRRKKSDPEGSSTSKRTAKSHRSKTRAPSSSYHGSDDESEPIDPPLDPGAAALHATVCGMVIETMAMSRASSLPVSVIYKMVMSEQPGLKEQRTEREWIKIFDRVLRDGEAGRGEWGLWEGGEQWEGPCGSAA
ncbi:hypothetical protein NLJ89_g8674 [Agrocybe chaxingu]|uniref:Uncharacterized protein n=1 Tax=Agrocybe chaxingu TaxID=84603 RepID=A0A9W8K206_9AGAR|nr:hypothetical protein NLJ89_g8674 [Agrocybe chaxingu]